MGLVITRGGRQTTKVAVTIDFTIVPPYFILEKHESTLKTIVTAWEPGQIGVTSADIHGSRKNCHGDKILCGCGPIQPNAMFHLTHMCTNAELYVVHYDPMFFSTFSREETTN